MRRAAPATLVALIGLVAAFGFVRAADDCSTTPCVYIPLIRVESRPSDWPIPTQFEPQQPTETPTSSATPKATSTITTTSMPSTTSTPTKTATNTPTATTTL